ncbi:MAG: hypothetical protein HY270_07130 [Deltaproteobacteria bacterium]|nr:hypothetical protein [Deltaproteobacteria bacterium]
MRRSLAALCRIASFFVITANAAGVMAQNFPFASHPTGYAAGAILPSHVSQAALDQAVRDFYDAWKQRYVKQTCGSGRYVVLTHVGPGNLTVSEGHGYGMLLMALMAGHDPQAHEIFDGMYAYYREHPTLLHSYLMAWKQGRSCSGGPNTLDSAADGDLDVAYALLLADKQWGSCGAVNYLVEAQHAIADLKAGDVDASAQYVLLGDWVLAGDSTYYPATRSSDFMPDHGRSYAVASGDSAWNGLIDQTYAIVDALQINHSPNTGLLPDFVRDPLAAPVPAGANFLEGPNDGAYDYNACRDPWRLATDFVINGETRAKTAVQKINVWIQTRTGGDPNAIASGYQLNGSVSPGANYLSMAFVAPLGVGAMVDAGNQAWLNTLWDLIAATPLSAGGYYENTLKLLSMIVMSGNWWAPQLVSAPTCAPQGTPLCTNGGYISGTSLRLGALLSASGSQRLTLSGKLFFPQGVPVTTPYTNGAQILVDDLGAGGSALFDLTHVTIPIPPAAAGACDTLKDGWTVGKVSTTYRNGSTALDPPVCTLGSSHGLRRLKYRPRTNRDLDFEVTAGPSTLAAPVGPLRATLVLGSTAAAGDNGGCGLSRSLTCSGTAGARRCK